MINASARPQQRRVTAFELLTADECGLLHEGVRQMRHEWLRRNADAPFFTMGPTAWRMDCGVNAYYDLKNRYNALLRERFGWFYGRLVAEVERHLGAAAVCDDKTALPPFQIHLFDSRFEKELIPLHIDRHHGGLIWDRDDELDFNRLVSFVVPVVLPSAGGGLEYWRISPEKFQKSSETERAFELHTGMEFEPYSPGRVVMQHGLLLHRPRPTPFGRDEIRIVVQGQAIWCNGKWRVFG